MDVFLQLPDNVWPRQGKIYHLKYFFIKLLLVEGYKNNQGPAQPVAHLLVDRKIIG